MALLSPNSFSIFFLRKKIINASYIIIIDEKYNNYLSNDVDFRLLPTRFRRQNYSRAIYMVHRSGDTLLSFEDNGLRSVPRRSTNWYRYCNDIIDVFSYWDCSPAYVCDVRAKPAGPVFMNVFIHASDRVCVM